MATTKTVERTPKGKGQPYQRTESSKSSRRGGRTTTTRTVETPTSRTVTTEQSGNLIPRGEPEVGLGSVSRLGGLFGNLTAPAIVATIIVTYRAVAREKMLPPPSDYVSVGIIYGGLSLFPDSASGFASAVGWGFVVAAFLNLWPFSASSSSPPNLTQPIIGGLQGGAGSSGAGPIGSGIAGGVNSSPGGIAGGIAGGVQSAGGANAPVYIEG